MRPSLLMSPTSTPIEYQGMWGHTLLHNIGEGTVAVVSIKLVGTFVVVGDIEIRAMISVVVPPTGSQPNSRDQ